MRSHLAAAARGALLASLFLCLLCATLSFSPAPRPALRAASSSGRAFHAPAAAPATPRLAPSRAAARRAWPVACTGAGGAGGAGGGTLESAVLGGGCFWCTEAVFLRAEGVERVTSGFAGGRVPDPSYREVVSGRTGHAEVVRVEFDSARISLDEVYDLHFASHDPTQLNRQGVDVGTQYRSAIFVADEAQRAAAQAAVARAQAARAGEKFLGLFPNNAKVVTSIEPLEAFYAADQSHQNYFERNPNSRYAMVNIAPKLQSYKVRSKLREIREKE